ncbi:unnamed protein product [Pleuronectes platessa]|uniref:Uncharacterized protein n=1 Tax=Pleuronectes platessa TaxID=8262 RepID=A0A9N7YKC8_PLEPL|nr:unnamed protein product [Pleuronectes platessa]
MDDTSPPSPTQPEVKPNYHRTVDFVLGVSLEPPTLCCEPQAAPSHTDAHSADVTGSMLLVPCPNSRELSSAGEMVLEAMASLIRGIIHQHEGSQSAPGSGCCHKGVTAARRAQPGTTKTQMSLVTTRTQRKKFNTHRLINKSEGR